MGPGDGGITIEYLHVAPGRPKLLLTRPGNVTNLGGNFFSLSFSQPLLGVEVASLDDGSEKLLTGRPQAGSFGPRVEDLVLQTTYLSEGLWVLRSEDNQLAVFRRTETQSVMDRRGLV